MKRFNISTIFILILTVVQLKAQTIRPTLEWTRDGSNTNLLGPSLNPITVNFLQDLLNPGAAPSSIYTFDPTPLVVTLSLRNQTQSTILTGTSTSIPGITFGGRNSDDNSVSVISQDPPGTPGIQAIGSAFLYSVFAAEIPVAQPVNNMYVTSPTSPLFATTGMAAGGSGSFGGGFDTEATSLASGPSFPTPGEDANFGIPVYVTTEPLADSLRNPEEKYLYGELVIKFNRSVINPVIHLGGLGGSYTYTKKPTAGGGNESTYFTTELQLVNGATNALTLMAGNLNIAVDANNNILNTNPTPNAGSLVGGDSYGAASGSIRVNGTYSELVFKVFMKGADGNFGWSQVASEISAADRDPMNGDVWYVSISTDKPTQQLSGNVYWDKDQLAGDIWRSSGGIVYEKTDGSDSTNVITNNQQGILYANLIDATTGLVIGNQPIGKDGSYLFDNIAVGTYRVALSGGPATIGATPPTSTQGYPQGWINTGQQIGLIPGHDGQNDGISALATIASGTILPNVNFGLAYNITLPVDLLNFNGSLNNETATLKWLVANEVNFARYELERSTDGVSFAKVATVDARRVAGQQQLYTQNDNLIGLNGKFYYRLKMINIDNSFKFSNIVIVRLGKIGVTEIYPNPFMESIKVEVVSKVNEVATVRIIDINGVQIVNQKHKLEIGGNQFTITNLAKLAQGTYILEVITANEKLIEKVVKLK
jgi:hypothetical protein